MDSKEVFENHLATGLESLLTAGTKNGYLNLSWLQQALQFVNHTHDKMSTLLEPLHSQEHDATWLRACAADIEKLLQVCGVLIRSIADIRYYQMFVQLALQSVQSNQELRAQNILTNCIDGLPVYSAETETSRLNLQRARLEGCISTLIELLERESEFISSAFTLNSGDSSFEVFFSMIYGTRTVAIFVLLVLAGGLTVRPNKKPKSESRMDALKDRAVLDEQNRPVWFKSLMRLTAAVREEIALRNSGSGEAPFAFLHELGRVDVAVRDLRAEMDRMDPLAVERCVEALRESVEQVEDGLPAVELHVNTICKTLTSSRAMALELRRRGWTGPTKKHAIS